MVELELKKWGNSVGVILPNEEIKELDLALGDKVDISIVKKKRLDGFGIAKGSPSFKREHDSHRDF
jgi:hypothetical protein